MTYSRLIAGRAAHSCRRTPGPTEFTPESSCLAPTPSASTAGAHYTLDIETGEIVNNAGGYLVPIEVTNLGGEVAAGLLVEGVLLDGDTVVETSSATFDYVPVGSLRHGGLIFREDPRAYELEVQARGYALP